jgi:hypothetical protein
MGEPPPDRRPVIIDADFDHSDIAALLVLLRDPDVDVRAITIAGTGLVHCQGGRLVTRYLIDELGVPDIPFGCGREKGGPDARPFPDEWRAAADAGYGLAITPQVESGVPRDAVDVLREAVDGSPSAPTVVTLGPLTNLEDACLDPTLPDRSRASRDAGHGGRPGNVFVDDHDGAILEWNASPIRPPSGRPRPTSRSTSSADATDDVPSRRTSPIASRPTTAVPARTSSTSSSCAPRPDGREQGQQLWDELAALTLSDPTS